MGAKTKFLLPEKRIPEAWYNIQADLPTPLPPVIHPGTGQPIGPADLAPLFPMELIKQEVSQERWIEHSGARYGTSTGSGGRRRSTARGASSRRSIRRRTSTTSTRACSPAGSHKPNTAVAQAYFNKAGRRRSAWRRRRAPVSGAARSRMACRFFGLECKVYMVQGLLPAEAVPPDPHADVRRVGVPSPARHARPADGRSSRTPTRRESLGIAISEAVEDAATRDGHEVLASAGSEPRPHAPDGDRPRGAEAARDGGGVSRRRRRLCRRGLELRRLRPPVRAQQPRDGKETPASSRSSRRRPRA